MGEFKISPFILIMAVLALLAGGTVSAAGYPTKPAAIQFV